MASFTSGAHAGNDSLVLPSRRYSPFLEHRRGGVPLPYAIFGRSALGTARLGLARRIAATIHHQSFLGGGLQALLAEPGVCVKFA
jgi:hypothetical protein